MSPAVTSCPGINTIVDAVSELCPNIRPELIMALHNELMTNRWEPGIFCALLACLEFMKRKQGVYFSPHTSVPLFFWVENSKTRDNQRKWVQTLLMAEVGLSFSRLLGKEQPFILSLNNNVLNCLGRHLMSMYSINSPGRLSSALVITRIPNGLSTRTNVAYSKEAGSRLQTQGPIELVSSLDHLQLSGYETEQANLWRLIEDLRSVVAP